MKRYKVLLIEDDPAIQALTSAFLRRHFHVLQATTVFEARAILAAEPVDIALLDLGLPDEDGLVLARTMRTKSPDPPIIFLTSRDTTTDKIRALDIGGDDYVTKPFDPDELVSRINAVLRRAAHANPGSGDQPGLTIGRIRIDLDSRRTLAVTGDEISLTRAEFDVFLALVNARGRVLSRATLLDAISTSPDHDAGERTVDALIAKIRRKLSAAGEEQDYVVTVHGVGYRLGLEQSRGATWM